MTFTFGLIINNKNQSTQNQSIKSQLTGRHKSFINEVPIQFLIPTFILVQYNSIQYKIRFYNKIYISIYKRVTSSSYVRMINASLFKFLLESLSNKLKS